MAPIYEHEEILPKKHKKHKRDKNEERPSGLKLILKVGNSSTPEHSSDSPGPNLSGNYSVAPTGGDEESMHSIVSLQAGRLSEDRQHRKAKKKKKKKEKDKDKHDKKKKHHHKEKRKRIRDESSQDDVSLGEESLPEPPSAKRMGLDVKSEPSEDHGVVSHGSPGREPRLCVQLLRQRQELLCAKSPLQKLLDHLQNVLEKRDPQQFFAWPVTDQIAPGYSQIIPQPMDFSTMKQKIDDNTYNSLSEYVEDFKLMCGNAMVYNHPETIYYKAAKRLLHAGVKAMSADKLRILAASLPTMLQISREQLGFDLGPTPLDLDKSLDSVEMKVEEEEEIPVMPVRRGPHYLPESKFEAIPDDLTPEEILQQTQKAAKAAAERLSAKKPNSKMGFLRTQKDGTTSLAIVVPNEGFDSESNEKAVCLGQLVGKLNHGSGTMQGFREDRRNVTKTVKPLYYGAFGSYAPSYDSTFANLSKEESDLVFQTYGDETAVQYAESILNFAKDCDYTLTMVDNLLDILTNGDHRKTKKVLEERRRYREEEDRIRQLMEVKPSSQPATPTSIADVKVEMAQLKTLSELGIETSFLDYFERMCKEDSLMQEKLDQTTVLLEKLQQVQSDRLSSAPPSHLGNVMQPTETELNLAEKITESLTSLAKQVPPGAVVSIPGIRKAMGIVAEPHPIRETASVGTVTDSTPSSNRNSTPDTSPLSAAVERSSSNRACLDSTSGDDAGSTAGEEEGVGVDLESELREFLESDTALTNFPLHDDKTIEEMLSES